MTTFAVVAGFAGAASGENPAGLGAIAVLVFGLANLFADATAMGLGAYLSARSGAQLRLSALARARRRLSGDAGALADALEAEGHSRRAAEQAARAFAEAPELAAAELARREAGADDPGDLRPAARGLATFLSFVVFGAVPIAPYVVSGPDDATLAASGSAALGALTALGLLRWRVTEEPLGRALGETLAVGGVCGAVAFAVGLAFRI